ncbi:hypothetical protein B0I35DRAFT_437894 [Stachybotrys elegans]|uniref:Uncharacterized protein n=1 Tax=Stachybotrys elegans TaxID=80388 RepID=A0A8K0WNZ7_9HYPO|nr:hypothetical protein B0I35DRAFT_437894 [Stachybotrys elegans]
MHFFTTTLSFIILPLFGMASAQPPVGDAIISVENRRTGVNSTVPVPIGPIFTGDAALSAVSTLYLTGSTGVPVDTVICTPFRNIDGTGNGGLPFTFGSPSFLSLNTVVVGSIVCQAS